MWKLIRRLVALALLGIGVTAGNAYATEGVISTLNSTTSTLLAAASFTGTFEEVTHFDLIRISIVSDQDGADSGAIIAQFSTDGSTTDVVESYSYYQKSGGTSANGASLLLAPKARYFRIKYTNGAVNQVTFRLTCIFQYSGVGISAQWGNNTFPSFACLASAARTTTQTLNIQRWGGRGVVISMAVSAFGASTTYTIDVNMTQAGGGVGIPRLARLTTTAGVNQQYYLIVYPGSSGTPDVAAQEKTYALVVPTQIQVVITPSNATSNTYEVSWQDLP